MGLRLPDTPENDAKRRLVSIDAISLRRARQLAAIEHRSVPHFLAAIISERWFICHPEEKPEELIALEQNA